jgi:glutaredoxin 3
MTQEIPDARQLLQHTVQQTDQPVTVFTLSWCSFCHAVRQLLESLKIPHSVIELDTGVYKTPEIHNRLRQDLQQMTGSHTLPQVFVGNTAVGGYTDTQTALRNGKLKALLAEHQIRLP